MEKTAYVTCPYCWQSFEIVVDASAGSQQFVTDCEVCCRPFDVAVECEGGELLNVGVLEG